MEESQDIKYSPKDFKSDQQVRWCPGCGDHMVLNAVQKALTELRHDREHRRLVVGPGDGTDFPRLVRRRPGQLERPAGQPLGRAYPGAAERHGAPASGRVDLPDLYRELRAPLLPPLWAYLFFTHK